jgi:hypothetical protein
VLYRPSAPTGYLTSVVATSSTEAWAAGTVTGSTGETRNWLLLRRIGRTWRRVRPPEVQVPGQAAVAASGPKNVWVFDGWIQRWDGRRWHEMLSALIGQFIPENSPVVLSPSDVWMYGMSFDHRLGSDYCLTSLEHWNGHRWTASSIKHSGCITVASIPQEGCHQPGTAPGCAAITGRSHVCDGQRGGG